MIKASEKLRRGVLRYAWNRMNRKKNVLRNILNKLGGGANLKMKDAFMQMYRNVIFYKITGNNCMWKWKISNITA